MKKGLNRLINLTIALNLVIIIAVWFGCHATASVEVRSSARAKARKHPVVKARPKPVAGKPVPPAQQQSRPQPPFRPQLAEGVTEAYAPCPNKPEVLNGIDDDCDGQVDEDWVKSGPLQVTLWWEGVPDLDLMVIDPSGKKIYYESRSSPTGGVMDKDSRSACKGGETIENVYWVKNPPKGTYIVKVRYYSTCGASKTNPPLVTANVGISYNGQFIGPYQKQMTFKDEVTMVKFVLE